MNRTIQEPPRTTEIYGSYDVVVAGGGIAGVAAAVTAARSGLRTCIIEKEFAFGGLATLGNVAVYLPMCNGCGVQVIAGIAEELLRLSIADGYRQVPPSWDAMTEVVRPDVIRKADVDGYSVRSKQPRYQVTFNPASFLLALDRFVADAGVTVLFDARVCGAVLDGGGIAAIIVEGKSERLALEGKVFIDATGDADLAHFAGAETVRRRTNVLAGWFYTTGTEPGLDLHKMTRHFDRYGRASEIDEELFDGCTSKDLTRFSLRSRALMSEHLARLENPTPVQLPSIPSVRMTRRIVGRRTLGVEPDSEESGAWPEDTVAAFGSWREAGPIHPLAFGSLWCPRPDNLMAAGRCMAADGMVWDLTRVISVCALTGEVAALGAAESISSHTPLSALGPQTIRDRIRERGGIPAA